MLRIALTMLLGDKAKYLGIVTAIALSSVIMIQQPAMLADMLAQTTGAITDIGLPDIWVMDPSVRSAEENRALRDTQLHRVRGVRGVDWAVPFFRGGQKVRLEDGETTQAQLKGLDDATLIGGPPGMVQGRLEDLRIPDAVVVDEAGAKGRLAVRLPQGGTRPLGVGDVLELNERRAVVVGVARSTPSFMSQPVLFTTYTRAKTYAVSERKLLSFVLAKARLGEAPEAVARRIERETGLKAYSSEEFKEVSLEHILKHTNMLMNLGFVVLIGFAVGAAVTGQVFYNFTLDNLRHFGVLKAMGASDAALTGMILVQALLAGFVGFGLGAGASVLQVAAAAGGMGPQPKITWHILAGSGAAVLLIVCLAALVSIRKVRRLEPGAVFKP
ncbi:hypothetical protein NNJEOMEG_02904 [Fundidesulfovibrio magnetotacticus]|uniref:ABC-type antimicrobial peptide transport system, permease component n=1 Tax=Fundidesulfovibrio magnetotacticus TaxID=2730080 RepID=A0A6V8LWT7_9BACT|nr:ABC transporter permease [Fundidesulfovibrio magnetotacticus]GFK95051.1 hypothetical protein NNJEOMEG_02904 [Fundidesulfovibrio magnetotacticus]